MRANLLAALFPAVTVTRFDAAQIDDHLGAGVAPSVVLMNPPFSVMANVSGRMADAALRHIASALARLAEGGRLVAITGASLSPETPAWRDAFIRLQERGRVVFTAAIDGAVYAKHGTTIDTRLTVIDKLPADDPTAFPASPGVAPDVATLLGWIGAHVPARLPTAPSGALAPAACRRGAHGRQPSSAARRQRLPSRRSPNPKAPNSSMRPSTGRRREGARLTDALYEDYGLQSIRIPGSQAHPTRLVQSAAMASVAPPKPSTGRTCRRTSSRTACFRTPSSKASFTPARLTPSSSRDRGRSTRPSTSSPPRRDDAENAVRFRRGWLLGDGTGAGKGRQVAGILLDNWLKGRRTRALDQQIRQADRGCAARLVGARHGAPARHAAFALSPGHADPAGGRRPVCDLRHAALRRARREGFARSPDRRMAGLRFRRSDRFRREPRHAERRRRRRANAATRPPRSRAAQACASSTPCRTPASSTSRRPARPPFTISPMPSASGFGAARTSRSRPAPNSSRRSRRAASPRWKCWRAISRRSASTPRARSPTRASNTSSSSTSSLDEQIRIYDAYAGAFAIIHNNLDAAMRGGQHHRRDGHAERARPKPPRAPPSNPPSSASSAICSPR